MSRFPVSLAAFEMAGILKDRQPIFFNLLLAALRSVPRRWASAIPQQSGLTSGSIPPKRSQRFLRKASHWKRRPRMASAVELALHRHPNFVSWSGSPPALGFSPMRPPLLGVAGVPELLLLLLELLDVAGALLVLVPEGCTVTSTKLASACRIFASSMAMSPADICSTASSFGLAALTFWELCSCSTEGFSRSESGPRALFPALLDLFHRFGLR